jgi:anti-sigma B factor antagonist
MTDQPVPPRLELKDIGDVTIASFTDRHLLDQKTVEMIGEQLFSLVDGTGRQKLLLDFSNVQDISSLAIGMLVTLNKKIRAAGGKLVLCRMDPELREVMAITQLDTMFTIRGDEDEALQAF